MGNSMESPRTGDVYRCNECELEIQVTKSCPGDDCTTNFQCCGQPLEKISAPPVQNA